jgi:hypothetical protein
MSFRYLASTYLEDQRNARFKVLGDRSMSTNARPTQSTAHQRWVLALTASAALMVILDMMVVGTAVYTIRTQLGASIDQLEWTISAYTL